MAMLPRAACPEGLALIAYFYFATPVWLMSTDCKFLSHNLWWVNHDEARRLLLLPRLEGVGYNHYVFYEYPKPGKPQ